MTLTVNQQAELEKPVTRLAFFVEFHFLSGIVYLSSLGQTITWGGHDWLGFGAIGNISPVNEAQGTAASALTFTLNVAQLEWLALATGDTAEYRGRDAKLYFCPLNEQFQLIDPPVICWRGTMDTQQVGIDGAQGEATGSISLKCETSAYGLKRKSALRLNAAQHKQKYPTDLGFDYLTDLIGNPDNNLWLTKRFQS
ncbi:MAG: hypothetical protein B7Y56_03000 [Gallionellales bacterium 35-53-114]|jgi:hypothetical protein|nr:MAG: hypothetical protein B7Y56_03000 [Gallionellales bacterium 35-53-114]OYZ65075.1 MAG: hypothetical protein B7Y04_00160 [Gallionellales bacterium 24-53-125]OZB07984.1 MAG: hypothetical protein B7X61_10610 [Gallionellales bacterium 39-52-133]HQS59724.1 hypothetical protein [Gallionellaceae bacterium]HQS76478.1 hypothetical protein [Gallionellaceae bacterium]